MTTPQPTPQEQDILLQAVLDAQARVEEAERVVDTRVEERRAAIIAAYEAGVEQRIIADALQRTAGWISRIRTGKRYR